MATAKDDVTDKQNPDELAEALNDLFSSISTMITSELHVTLIFSSETIVFIISIYMV